MSNTENPGTGPVDPIDAEPAESRETGPVADTASTADPADSTDTTAYDVDTDLARPVSATSSVSASAGGAEWPAATDAPERFTPTPAYTPGDAYTPAATVGAAAAAAVPSPAATPPPIYVQAPTPPKTKGNRAGGILIGLVATLVFALVYAAAAFAVLLVRPDSDGISGTVESFTLFLQQPAFWGTAIVFFLAWALLVAIVNRRTWAAYVLGGFGVGVLVYLGYIAVVVLQVRIWEFTPDQASKFLAVQWLSPIAIIAGLVGREVSVWFGAWSAKRGRKVTARNVEAQAEYERLIDAGPQLTRL